MLLDCAVIALWVLAGRNDLPRYWRAEVQQYTFVRCGLAPTALLVAQSRAWQLASTADVLLACALRVLATPLLGALAASPTALSVMFASVGLFVCGKTTAVVAHDHELSDEKAAQLLLA